MRDATNSERSYSSFASPTTSGGIFNRAKGPTHTSLGHRPRSQ